MKFLSLIALTINGITKANLKYKNHFNISLFAYGTLTDPEFVKELIGRSPPMVPARLPGFEKIVLPGEKYPIAVKAPGSLVEGKLLTNLSPKDLKIFDRWERRKKPPRDLYKRINVNVLTAEGEKSAFAYVAKEKTL